MKHKLKAPEHSRLVKHAKYLSQQRQKAKWDICKIALKVCFFSDKKGGRVSPDKYSITNFAEDIGMNRKTLSCWVLDYELVYTKLGIDDSKFSMHDRIKLGGTISRTRSMLFNMNKTERSVAHSFSNDVVIATFDSIMSLDGLTKRLDDFNGNLSHHLFTFSHEKFLKKHLSLVLEYEKKLQLIQSRISKIKGDLK
jgi:hypothetical protein